VGLSCTESSVENELSLFRQDGEYCVCGDGEAYLFDLAGGGLCTGVGEDGLQVLWGDEDLFRLRGCE